MTTDTDESAEMAGNFISRIVNEIVTSPLNIALLAAIGLVIYRMIRTQLTQNQVKPEDPPLPKVCASKLPVWSFPSWFSIVFSFLSTLWATIIYFWFPVAKARHDNGTAEGVQWDWAWRSSACGCQREGVWCHQRLWALSFFGSENYYGH